MTICTYNALTLASKASIEGLLMQARKIKYDVIGLSETRRHRSLNATYNTGEEVFLRTCDRKGVGEVGVLVSMRMAVNIYSLRTANNPNQTLAVEEMWFKTGRDYFRRVRSDTRLRRR